MKKIFLFMFISIFIISVNVTQACEEIIVNIPVNGCEYQVIVCVDCTIGVAPTTLAVKSVMKIDNNCEESITPEEILYAINNLVSTYDFIYSNLCVETNYVPLPCYYYEEEEVDPDIIQSQITYLCFKKTYVWYFDEWHINYVACDYDNYCLEEFYFCWIWMDGAPQYTKVTTSFTLHGSQNCTLESWEADFDECFKAHTACY